MSDELCLLANWYLKQCDGEWQHQNGIKIETLDNPGWSVSIDVGGTVLAEARFDPVRVDRTEADWLQCRVRDARFEGFGGATNLTEILRVFLAWARSIDTSRG